MKSYSIENVTYTGQYKAEGKEISESVHPIGIDTEAYKTGKCFLICTSLGDIWKPEDLPECLFTRANRDNVYVAYNLKYDESAILQQLPIDCLKELRITGKTEFNKYTYRFIAYKFLSIRKSNHTVTFYDMYGFFGGSLDYNAEKYLHEKKFDIGTKSFTKKYVQDNWKTICDYCIQDAKLVQRLAELLIGVFESYGVYPRKLYSTAYVSYQYFKSKCFYVTVKRFYEHHKELLNYAMHSYNGGKFEITKKGRGYYYEYDIISAYPYEIANLVDISDSRVIYSTKYRNDAIYGFIKCDIFIPKNVHSPAAIKVRELCIFPNGSYRKVITKNEFDYLQKQGCELHIIDAVWICVDKLNYPYREAINHLVQEKMKHSTDKHSLYYHTVKILMNSLYGKFVQLIKKDNRYFASTCWNPIYGSVITANTRIKVTELQQKYHSICAVHTDSVISTEKLPFTDNPLLGDFKYECEGDGVILGCGVYQVGKSSKIRGFQTKIPLMELCDTPKDIIKLKQNHVISWKEVTIRFTNTDEINHFVEITKELHVRMDRKRIWANDFMSFREALSKQIESFSLDARLINLMR